MGSLYSKMITKKSTEEQGIYPENLKNPEAPSLTSDPTAADIEFWAREMNLKTMWNKEWLNQIIQAKNERNIESIALIVLRMKISLLKFIEFKNKLVKQNPIEL